MFLANYSRCPEERDEIKMMKHDKKIDWEQFQEIINLELATVVEIGQLRYRIDLVNAYRNIGMHKQSLNELNRIVLVNPDDCEVHAKILLTLAEQGSFRQLSQYMVRHAIITKDCSPCLTLSLARSFALVGCRDEAAKYYDKFLRIKDAVLTNEILGYLSEFIAKGPMTRELGQILIQLSKTETETSSDKLWNYILSRLYTDANNYFLADSYLLPLAASDIDNKFVAFDLSLVIFRLADLKRSRDMVKRALEIDPGYKSAQAFLVSLYSFLGDLEKASSILESYGLSSPVLALSQQQVNAIVEYAVDGKHPIPCSNAVAISHSGTKDFRQNFAHKNDPKNYANEKSDVVTVSCFGTGIDEGSNPWEILMSIDRRHPHVMVQKIKGYLRLHAFIASCDSILWPWQEVAISLGAEEKSLGIDIEYVMAVKEEVVWEEKRTTCEKFQCFETELLQNPFLIEENYE